MNKLTKDEERIKQLLNSKEFEYNPADWEAAEKLLNAQPKPIRFNAVWLTLPVLIIAASIIRLSSPTPSAIATQQQNKSNSAPQALLQNTPSPVLHGDDANNSINSTIETPASDINTTPKADAEATPIPVSPKNYKEIKKSSPAQQSKDIVPKNTEPNTSTTNDKEQSKKEQDAPSVADAPSITKNDAEQKDKNTTAPIITDSSTTSKNNNPAIADDIPPMADTNSIAKIPAREKEEKDKAAKKETNTNNQILLKHSIAAVLGANYSKLLQTNSQYISAPYFGVQYQYQPNNKWKFASGIGYSYVSTNGFEKQYTEERYSFGYTQQKTNISTNKLHYIEIPLLARYTAFSGISIVGGANISYLLTTNNTVSQSTTSTIAPPTMAQKQENAYTRGINKWDAQLQLGVEYKINNNLHIGLLANGGLLDVSKNNYYNTTVFDRNSRLQLFIKYDFFRF